jgi:hypothetical protein
MQPRPPTSCSALSVALSVGTRLFYNPSFANQSHEIDERLYINGTILGLPSASTEALLGV